MSLIRLLSTTARCLSGLMIHSEDSNLYLLSFSLFFTLYLFLPYLSYIYCLLLSPLSLQIHYCWRRSIATSSLCGLSMSCTPSVDIHYMLFLSLPHTFHSFFFLSFTSYLSFCIFRHLSSAFYHLSLSSRYHFDLIGYQFSCSGGKKGVLVLVDISSIHWILGSISQIH